MSITLEEVSEALEQLTADAKRWEYVRDHMAQKYTSHTDGKYTYRICWCHKMGETFTEVVDKAIADRDQDER